MTDQSGLKSASVDSMDLLSSSQKSLVSSTSSTPPVRLRDHLKEKISLNVQFDSVPVESTSGLSTENIRSILNPDGIVDVDRFTDSMIQSNRAMSNALSQNTRSTTSVNKLKEKRLIENPPLLLSTATYVEFMIWMDLVLANLKRHPDFRYQFLTAPPVAAPNESSRQRFDDIYEFIKDKLDITISQNPTLQQLVSSYTSIYQIHLWWKALQDHFLPSTEFAKQQRETKFANLKQKPAESNKVFIQRVQAEAEMLKFVNQEVSESRLRLRITAGLTDSFQQTMAQLNTTPILSEWIEYIEEMERIEKRKTGSTSISQIPMVSAIYKPVTRSAKTVSDTQQHRLHQQNKRDVTKHEHNSDKVRSNKTMICYNCEDIGHHRNQCPYRHETEVRLEQLRQQHRRSRFNHNYKSTSSRSTNDSTPHANAVTDINQEDQLQRQFQLFKDLTLANTILASQIDSNNEAIMNIDENETKEGNEGGNFAGVITTCGDRSSTNLASPSTSLFYVQQPFYPQSTNNPIIDSGATRHMFNNLAHFSNFKAINDINMQVEVAQGTRIRIFGVGSVGLLEEVLYIPELKFSIISISSLDNLQYNILFANGIVTVYDKNNKLFLIGTKNNYGLYVLGQQYMETLLEIPPIVCVVHQYTVDPYLNIHACLGHASAQRTRYICQCNKLKGLDSLKVSVFESIRNCSACKMAKATKRSFPGHFQIPTKSGFAWQFDVKGRIEQASLIYGSHYEYFQESCSLIMYLIKTVLLR